MRNIYVILFAIVVSVHLNAQQSIGIGTTSPQASSILDISSTTKGLLIPRMTSTQRVAIASPAQGLLVFQNNGTTSLGYWYHDGSTWQRFAKASELGGLSSWTISGINQYSDVAGNVGIGVTSGINEKLFVKGNVLITHVNGNDLVNGGNVARLKLHGANTGSGIIEFLKPDTSVAATISFSSVGNAMNLRNATSSTYMRFYSSGKIGIGTGLLSDEALSSLHIKTGDFANYSDNHGYLMMGNSGGLNVVMSHYEILARDNGAAAPLYLQQDGGAVRIGNSGITADTRLHITDGGESSLTTHGYLLLGTTGSSNLVMDPNEIQARINGAATTLRLQQDGGSLLVQGGALTVGSTGNVGIGDLSPDVPLDVEGDAIFNGTNPTIALHNSNVQKGFIQLSDDNFRVGTFSDNAAGSFVVRTNGGDRMFVNPSGNVGIGVSNPVARLDIAGGGIRVVRNGEALAVDGVNPYIQYWQNGVAKFYTQQSGNNMIISYSGGNTTGQLRMFASRVGINTSSPATGYSLSVGGAIICEELRVELSGAWPDYVFAEDYKLRPLSELRTFVAENRHLPNIPAAAQVENEGFNVGDMNRKLLEKVEELTLYILQQQEEIDALKKSFNELKQ